MTSEGRLGQDVRAENLRHSSGATHVEASHVTLEAEAHASRAAAAALGLDVLVGLMEQSLNGIVVVDAHRRYRYVNPAARRAMGYRLDELVGRDFLLNFPEHEHQAMIEHFEASLAGAADIWNATLVRPDGSECEIAYANMVIDIDGQPHGAAIFRDVTELHLATDQASALARLASTASADTDLPRLLDSLAQAAVDGVGAAGCAVVVSGDNDKVQSVGTAGLPDGYAGAILGRPWSSSHMATLPGFAAGRPAVLLRRREEMASEPELAALSALLDDIDWLGAVYVPVVNRGQLLGGIAVYLPSSASGPTEAQETFLRALADQAGTAVMMAQLVATSRDVAALSERSRLARELHDSVSQALFSMTLHARAAERHLTTGQGAVNAPALAAVEKLTELTQGALAEMRALIFELRPGALAEEGLAAAVTRQAAALTAREGVAITVIGPGDRPNLDPHVEEHLYRLVLEALNNAVKHAKASQITVSMAVRDGELIAVVEDDGVGFDPAEPHPGHMGQQTMADRAAQIGAVFAVDSRPGAGARVRVAIRLR